MAEAFYDDGYLFAGHSIVVTFDSAEQVMSVYLGG
jgi:hypothetical protein